MSAFPLGRPARLAVFASGRGSNLAALLAAFPALEEPDEMRDGEVEGRESEGRESEGRVVVVVSDRPDALALERAERAGAAAVFIPWTTRSAFERRALQVLRAHAIDLVCLAGFMRILSPAFVARYHGRLLNIHPSLLPRFPGLYAQRQALAAGARESGCTVHFVDAGVDTGPIILQRRVPVLPHDTEATLAARILAEEHLAYPEAVRRVLAGAAHPMHVRGLP